MAVPKRGDEYSADRVKIAATFCIPVIEALRFVKDQGIAKEFGHLGIIQKRSLEQLLLTGIDCHSSSK
jgi:hypothetical protein